MTRSHCALTDLLDPCINMRPVLLTWIHSMDKKSHTHWYVGPISYPFPSFNGSIVQDCKGIINFIPHFILDVITCTDLVLINYNIDEATPQPEYSMLMISCAPKFILTWMKTVEWVWVNGRNPLYLSVGWSLPLKLSSSRHAVVFVQYIKARCRVENEDVVGAAPTGDASTTSEWSTILLPAKVRLVLEVLRYVSQWHMRAVENNQHNLSKYRLVGFCGFCCHFHYRNVHSLCGRL